MVLIKAAFNGEVRRLAIGIHHTKSTGPGITYTELVQKLISAFPLADTKESDVRLYYKDSDGDRVCFGSDEELQAAIGCIGEDNTLRVLIGVVEQQQQQQTAPAAHISLLFDTDDIFDDNPFSHGLSSLFGSTFTRHPFSPIGGLFREQALREREEHLRQQRLYEEKVRRAELERRKALLEKVKQAREQHVKQLAESRRKSQEVSTTAPKSLLPEFPAGWSVSPFGSWEPVVHECPHFTQWTWGPYGYHATFTGEAEKKEEEKEEEKMDDQPQEDAPAAATATQE